MMDDSHLCDRCYSDYDGVFYRPRSLPCGHAFCTHCISMIIKDDEVTCRTCHDQHSATFATEFPINYGMEALIRKFKGTQVAPVVTVAAPTRDIGKKLRSLVEEQVSSISSLITSCEVELSQLGEYRGQLEDWTTHHLQLQDRLNGLVEQNKEAMKLLEQEKTSVLDMTRQGEKGKTELHTIAGSLDTVNTAQEADIALDSADECYVEVDQWLHNCQKLFPDVNTVYTSVQVQETIRKALDMTTIDTDDSAFPVLLEDSSSSIMNKVQDINLGISREHLTVEELRKRSEPVKGLVEAGRVFAVQLEDGGRRSAKITLQDGELCLHSLLHKSMPAHAFTLQESEVLGVLNPSCTKVFLDLGWAGSTKGRVTIRLTPDTMLARQFLLLCTGQQGSTYLNTKMLRIVTVNNEPPGVVGGDYESNDGEGGAPLLPLTWYEKYRASGRAGAVWSIHGLCNDRTAQYVIATSSRKDGKQWSHVFGDVVSGLDVVKEAANYSDITEVTVVDCGVVLPL